MNQYATYQHAPVVSGTLELGCLTGSLCVTVSDLRAHVQGLLAEAARAGVLSLEATFVQVGTICVPLCQDDLLRCSYPSVEQLRMLYGALLRAVEGVLRRPLLRSVNSTVRAVAEGGCALYEAARGLLDLLAATGGFSQVSLATDRQARAHIDEAARVLDECSGAGDVPPAAGSGGGYARLPLPLLAVATETSLFGAVLGALLGRHDVRELARRGSLYYQVLKLVRAAVAFPELAAAMATPPPPGPSGGGGGGGGSVLAALRGLDATAAVFIEMERLSPRVAGDYAHDAAGPAGALDDAGAARESMGKMARRVRQTYAALNTKVERRSESDLAAASAMARHQVVPSEAAQLDALLQAGRRQLAGAPPAPAPASAANSASASLHQLQVMAGGGPAASPAAPSAAYASYPTYLDQQAQAAHDQAAHDRAQAAAAAAYGGSGYHSGVAAAAALDRMLAEAQQQQAQQQQAWQQQPQQQQELYGGGHSHHHSHYHQQSQGQQQAHHSHHPGGYAASQAQAQALADAPVRLLPVSSGLGDHYAQGVEALRIQRELLRLTPGAAATAAAAPSLTSAQVAAVTAAVGGGGAAAAGSSGSGLGASYVGPLGLAPAGQRSTVSSFRSAKHEDRQPDEGGSSSGGQGASPRYDPRYTQPADASPHHWQAHQDAGAQEQEQEGSQAQQPPAAAPSVDDLHAELEALRLQVEQLAAARAAEASASAEAFASGSGRPGHRAHAPPAASPRAAGTPRHAAADAAALAPPLGEHGAAQILGQGAGPGAQLFEPYLWPPAPADADASAAAAAATAAAFHSADPVSLLPPLPAAEPEPQQPYYGGVLPPMPAPLLTATSGSGSGSGFTPSASSAPQQVHQQQQAQRQRMYSGAPGGPDGPPSAAAAAGGGGGDVDALYAQQQQQQHLHLQAREEQHSSNQRRERERLRPQQQAQQQADEPPYLVGLELVGDRAPLCVLCDKFSEVRPLLAAQLVSLEADFPAYRRIAGDGNCFYRSALFALLEAVLTAPNPCLGDRMLAAVERHCRWLETLPPPPPPSSHPSSRYSSPYDPARLQRPASSTTTTSTSSASSPRAAAGPGASPSPLRGSGGSGGSTRHRRLETSSAGPAPDDAQIRRRPDRDRDRGPDSGSLSTRRRMREADVAGGPGSGDLAAVGGPAGPLWRDPQALEGGRLLCDLLRLAWYKSPDVDQPADLSAAEDLLRHPARSAAAIKCIRSMVAAQLLVAAADYEPFVPGCGADYAGLSLAAIVQAHVLPLGRDAEQLQVLALARCLGAPLGVLDCGGQEAVSALKHPAGPEPPAAWVVHEPGHYEVVYARVPMDVVAGQPVQVVT